MSRFIKVFAVVAVNAILATPLLRAQGEEPKDTNSSLLNMVPGSISEGLKSSLSLKKVRDSSSETIVLRITIQNVTQDKSIQLGTTFVPEKDFDIAIEDTSGTKIPFRWMKEGKPEPNSDSVSLTLYALMPGESRQFDVNLSKLYDLSAAETYKIIAKRWVRRLDGSLENGGRAELISEPLIYTISR